MFWVFKEYYFYLIILIVYLFTCMEKTTTSNHLKLNVEFKHLLSNWMRIFLRESYNHLVKYHLGKKKNGNIYMYIQQNNYENIIIILI